ncbi:K(+)-transporting ATPase subunit C [Calothrix sp. 336/3]|uniref:K(+)-transporting ATPase subunit C n=1 Tax=Calothrix sp. 336/3 TaxID=1337936 RepID=UPI0006244421|nr:K(+)-transporting ATPase subunit C [Calothrix sp. 336/3]AKG20457.1 potassium-transporting ATPase subunit C [Calothrix sp. 336/3]
MSILRSIIRAIRMTLIIWVLTAMIYPAIIWTVGSKAFPVQANGSTVFNIQGEPIGSALIGQQFKSDKYFHGRPSTIRYSQGRQARPRGISGASNLAPSNPDLLDRITQQANQLRDDNIQPLSELIYTSGSGLDPHISVRAVREQLERVSKARGIRAIEILPLIEKYTDGRFLGIFGEPGVNILRLNYDLDLQDFNRRQSSHPENFGDRPTQ